MADKTTPSSSAAVLEKSLSSSTDNSQAKASPASPQPRSSSSQQSHSQGKRPQRDRDNRGGGYQHSQSKGSRRGGATGVREREQQNRNKNTASAAAGGPQDETTTVAEGSTGQQQKKKKYSVRKRAPPREEIDIQPNDIFVNEKSPFPAQLSKCRKLLDKGYTELNLHGLGNAIPKAINLALELKKVTRNTINYTVNTSTIQVYDDITDFENPEQPVSSRTRNVSTVNIKISRIANFP